MTDPYRTDPVGPVDPICIACKHKDPTTVNPNSNFWGCLSHPPVVTKPESRNNLTGEIYEAVYLKVYCVDKNGNGQCQDFKPIEPAQLVPRVDQAIVGPAIVEQPSWFHRMAARLGAWLVSQFPV